MAVRKGLEENLTWLGRKKSVHPRDKGWEEGRLRDIPRSATKPSAVSQCGTGKECSCVSDGFVSGIVSIAINSVTMYS